MDLALSQGLGTGDSLERTATPTPVFSPPIISRLQDFVAPSVLLIVIETLLFWRPAKVRQRRGFQLILPSQPISPFEAAPGL